MRAIAAGLFVCLLVSPAAAQPLVPSSSDAPEQAPAEPDKTDRAGILRDYAVSLSVQQAYRLPLREIRERLGGPFWRDYADSITHLKKGFWDGDEPYTWNLIVHPMMGGLSYHQARTRGASRGEAFLWTVAYSTHFELGVLGQAGLGNNRVSPVDLIVTPVAGVLWAALEEWIERRCFGGGGPRLLRSLLPVHALTNLQRGRAPWRPHADLPKGHTK